MKTTLKLTLLLAIAVALNACAPAVQSPTPHTPPTPQQQYVAQSVLVVFAPNSHYKNTVAEIEAQHKGVRLKRILMDMGETIIGEFSVPQGQEKHFVRVIARHPNVQSAELNLLMHIAN